MSQRDTVITVVVKTL